MWVEIEGRRKMTADRINRAREFFETWKTKYSITINFGEREETIISMLILFAEEEVARELRQQELHES